jgi:hypothetical protein
MADRDGDQCRANECEDESTESVELPGNAECDHGGNRLHGETEIGELQDPLHPGMQGDPGHHLHPVEMQIAIPRIERCAL